MSNESRTTFAGGEATPKIDTRVDTEKYVSLCRRLENMIPRAFGSATKRPGTTKITTGGSVQNIFDSIIGWENQDVCHENNVVSTVASYTSLDNIICHENSIVSYDNDIATTETLGYTASIVCHDNEVVFYENNIVRI